MQKNRQNFFSNNVSSDVEDMGSILARMDTTSIKELTAAYFELWAAFY